MKHRTMDPMPNGPLADLEEIGDILMRRTSDKEYYRFLRIQKECRSKWQATIDKLDQLMTQRDKLTLQKAELNKKLKHASRMWATERQARQKVEKESNFLRLKLERTYEILRSDLEKNEGRLKEKAAKTYNNNDEITSTGSFLSNLSDISGTENEVFETLFEECMDMCGEPEKENDRKHVQVSQWLDKSLFEKTFQVKLNKNETCAQISNENSKLKSNADRPKLQIPSKTNKKYSSDQITDSSYSYNHASGQFQQQNSSEYDKGPIYERIDDDTLLFEHDDENKIITSQRNGNERSDMGPLISEVNTIPEQDVDPHSCQHKFSHRSASRSVVCFLCSKKFRFGILAFKCASCKIFVHLDCKAQMKIAAKTRILSDIHYISDYAPLDGPGVPALIVQCVNQVELRGLNERGIYRVSGSEKEIKALKERFLRSNDFPDLSVVDMHVICGCIKSFLKGLREPLIPTWLWSVFSKAVVDFDGDSINGNILRNLQSAIIRLPKANRDTLAFLVLHLQRVATCHDVQMPISNLAKVFGPTLIGYSSEHPDYATILGETIIQQNVMQHFLSMPTDYWFSFICEDLTSK